jgi:23S rRNA pseudouridine1911/1915/1917 synthase
LDAHVVVVEKPSGISTVRHPAELAEAEKMTELPPTLQELVPPIIARREGRPRKGPLPQLRVVQRLDKDTSGLVVFARTIPAEAELGRQLQSHTFARRYLAIIPGYVPAQRIVSWLVRDRGDGRRGSNPNGLGKQAITKVEPIEMIGDYTLMSCELETGRTHQIRIHLGEMGHPLCGEEVYSRKVGAPPRVDTSGAPRLALHATELGFIHPETQEEMFWEMPLPPDLSGFLAKLRGAARK